MQLLIPAAGYNDGVTKAVPAIVLLLIGWSLSGCPQSEKPPPQASATSSAASPNQGPTGPEAGGPESKNGAALVPQTEAPKQLILIYTGQTLSRPDALRDFDPAEGGLSALTATIINYEAQIVEYNRLRVLNSGGNADSIRTDLTRGMLGDHPFMLLDYGFWSRPNDFLGDTYVGLYFRMFHALKYTAVACPLFERLPPERWAAYLPLMPEELSLLASTGQPQSEGIPTTDLVTRQIHGGLWGVVAVPLPKSDEDAQAVLGDYVEQAAAKLAEARCDYSILLLADGPAKLYNQLAADSRFSVVIGAPSSHAVPEGYGEMPADGALLLPELEANGREVGVCHLYYTAGGDRPVQYNFSRKTCIDDLHATLPFRKQVAEAVAEHKSRYDEWAASQKSAGDQSGQDTTALQSPLE